MKNEINYSSQNTKIIHAKSQILNHTTIKFKETQIQLRYREYTITDFRFLAACFKYHLKHSMHLNVKFIFSMTIDGYKKNF